METNRTAAQWKFQTTDCVDASGIHSGNPTDSRGLKLRAESGYGWVNMGDGWLQISFAVRKLQMAEVIAIIAAVQETSHGQTTR